MTTSNEYLSLAEVEIHPLHQLYKLHNLDIISIIIYLLSCKMSSELWHLLSLLTPYVSLLFWLCCHSYVTSLPI